jgi:hypothetical protein
MKTRKPKPAPQPATKPAPQCAAQCAAQPAPQCVTTLRYAPGAREALVRSGFFDAVVHCIAQHAEEKAGRADQRRHPKRRDAA